MTDRTCTTCKHLRHHDGGEFCHSPQLAATNRGYARSKFESDSYQGEFGRETEAKRKCGKQFLNWERA